MKNVRYEKAQREKAKREKKYLVTIDVNGHGIAGDSATVQRIADEAMAKRVAQLAIKLMRGEL